jgi:hypothetical protein
MVQRPILSQCGRALPRRTLHPGCGFLVGPQQQRTGHLTCSPRAQQPGRRKHHGAAARQHFIQRRDAVQVRVDRDHHLEMLRKQAADVTLAHGLARREGDVLPHVGKVGADQHQTPGAQVPRSRRGDHQLHQLFVGLVQATPEHHRALQCRRQAQLQLAVGKAVALDDGQRHAERLGERRRRRALVVEGKHPGDRLHVLAAVALAAGVTT